MKATKNNLTKLSTLPLKVESFAERLKIIIGDQSARSFASEIGLSSSAVHAYLIGKSDPTRAVLSTISHARDINPQWLLDGSGPMRKNNTFPSASDAGRGILAAAAEPQPFIITDFEGNQTEVNLAPNLVHMPVLSLDAACGRGACGDNAYITSMVSATEDWFRLKVRKDPRDMCLVHALGDSMEPLIEDGDMVFFDKTSKNRPCDGIWVFSYEERLFLKRLQFLPDSKIKVISSNTAYEPYVISINESFRLFGRYVAVLGFRT